MTLGTGGEVEPGEMPGGVGTTPFEADPLRLQPPPALVNAPTAPAGGDPPTGKQDPVGVGQEAARRDGADQARPPAAERHARDLTLGRPLSATDQCRDGGDPIAAYSGSTQTLVAVSRLNVSSRSAA